MFKKIILFIGFSHLLIGQDQTPKATYDFEEDANYINKRENLIDQIKIEPSLATFDSLTDWAFIHKDWETVLDFAPKAITLSPTALRYFRWGGAAGFRSLEVSRIFALPYVGKMKDGFNKAHEIAPENKLILRALVETYSVLPTLLGGDINYAKEKANTLFALDSLEGAIAKGYIAETENQADQAKKYYKMGFDIYRDIKSKNKNTQFLKQARRELMYELGSIAVRFQMNYEIGTKMLQEYLKQYTKRDIIPLKWVYFRLAELAEFQNQRVQAAIYYGEVKRIDPNWSGVSKKIKELGL